MDRLTKSTLASLRDQLAAHGFTDAELEELVAPKLGIITGFQDLLDELETLRRTDLGTLPPAGAVRPRKG